MTASHIDGMKKNYYYLSLLRVIACVAVIVLHITASETILYQETLSSSQLFSVTLIYNLMMWAVPCFVMVSGALLLDPEKEIGFRKILGYLKRVLLALIIFSMVFRLFDMVMDREPFTVSGLLQGLLNAYTGSGWSHLWYLYLIIGLYLILPALRAITKRCTEKELMYLTVVGILVLSLFPLTKLFGIASGFYLHVNTIYPVYFILGYMLFRNILIIRRNTAILFCIIGIAGIFFGTWAGLKGLIQNPTVLTGYASPFVIVLSTSIFSLVEKAKEPAEKMKSIVLNIDQCSFGIYLIHMVFVRLLLRYMQVDLFDYPFLLALLCVLLLVFIISFWLVAFFRKIFELLS